MADSLEGHSSLEGEGSSTASFPALLRVSAHTPVSIQGISARSWAPAAQAPRPARRHVQRARKGKTSRDTVMLRCSGLIMQRCDSIESCSCVPVTTLGQTKKVSAVFDKLDTVHIKRPESVILGRSTFARPDSSALHWDTERRYCLPT